jgi:hypothetical protein
VLGVDWMCRQHWGPFGRCCTVHVWCLVELLSRLGHKGRCHSLIKSTRELHSSHVARAVIPTSGTGTIPSCIHIPPVACVCALGATCAAPALRLGHAGKFAPAPVPLPRSVTILSLLQLMLCCTGGKGQVSVLRCWAEACTSGWTIKVGGRLAMAVFAVRSHAKQRRQSRLARRSVGVFCRAGPLWP